MNCYRVKGVVIKYWARAHSIRMLRSEYMFRVENQLEFRFRPQETNHSLKGRKRWTASIVVALEAQEYFPCAAF